MEHLLPLWQQDLFILEDRPKSSVSAPVGLMQKSVLFKQNCLLMWAGSYIIALAIAREFYSRLNGVSEFDFLDDVVHGIGLPNGELEQISLISFLDIGPSIAQAVLNVSRLGGANSQIVYAGTGAFPTILDVSNPISGSSYDELRNSFLDRFSAALIGEIITQENAIFSAGGWFEIIEVKDAVFRKVPYALKLWSVNNDMVIDGPAFVSGYVGYDLLVFLLDKRVSYARQPFFIPDMLSRSGLRSWDGRPVDLKHELEIHLVHFNDLKRAACFILGETRLSITLDTNTAGCRWSINPDPLKDFIQDVRQGKSGSRHIDRNSQVKM